MNILTDHMGSEFYKLPPLVQKVHIGRNRLEGMVQVSRGNLLAQLICTVFRFPKASEHCRLVVNCDHTDQVMLWHRNFDGLDMVSHFRREGEYLIERLGPLVMYFKALAVDGCLRYDFRYTKLFGIRLPVWFSPRIDAQEYEEDGHYRFSVQVTMPVVGKVISYFGVMSVDSTPHNP